MNDQTSQSGLPITMCGISCIVALQNSRHQLKDPGPLPNGIEGAEIDGDLGHNKLAKELDDSLELIKHRGPDSRGQWISSDKRVGPLTSYHLVIPP